MKDHDPLATTPLPDAGSPIRDGRTSTGPSLEGDSSGTGVAADAGPSIEPGTILLGRYQVDRLLGRGGMGSVFVGRDLKLERAVAVKVLDLPGRKASEKKASLEREAVLLARLQHPNIVAIHEIGEHEDMTFFVMDLVKGATTEDVLSHARRTVRAEGGRAPRNAAVLIDAIGEPAPQGRRSLAGKGSWYEAVARIMREVSRTIEEAHAEGVIHRDIKPRNVMLRGDGSPVVLDFGLAGSEDNDVASAYKGLVGTVAYMAPEQVAAGRTGNDPRSDIYQLGLLLYEFLTLQRAYPGDDAQAVLSSIQRGRFRMPRSFDPGIPRDLEAICLKAIELDPRRRYASAGELREDLSRFISREQPPIASQGGAFVRLLRSGRYALRRRRIVAAAVLALGAGLTAGNWIFEEEPLDVRWFRVRAGIESGAPEEVSYYPDVASVRFADRIGAIIETDGPKYVYAMSVFGELSPPTWMLPMQVQLLDADRRSDNDGVVPDDPWAMRVEAGETRLICTEIASVEDAVPYEGLWLYVSDQPVPRISQWMDQLHRLASDGVSNAGRVGYAVARALFEAGPGALTRGKSATLSKAEKRRVSDLLTAETIMGQEWILEDPKRFHVSMKVDR